MMRIINCLICVVFLSSCAGFTSPVPGPNAANGPNGSLRNPGPSQIWFCGQPPSARRRENVGTPLGSGYKSLYSFKAGNDGGYPYGNLVAVGSKFYGTTDQGGKYGYGTVYDLTTAGTEKVLYSFRGPSDGDGAYPCAGLVDVKGTLYGTTPTGGGYDWGTIYSVTTSGTEHVVYNFKAGTDAAAPYAQLLSFNGKLYGTTVEGGATGWGTVFESSTGGSEQVLYSFKAADKDGARPYGNLIAVKNDLYGTTQEGGTTGWGTLFKVSTSGKEHVLYSFKAGNDGGYPFSGVTYLNGKLYGTTKYGGANGYGTVFESNTAGSENVIYSFKAGSDGAYPYDGLLAYNGTLYGTTVFGGVPNWGAVFKVSPSGAEKVLYTFTAGNNGANPFAGLTELNAQLYGVTQGGGKSGWGTAFTIAP